jgi:CubicO group peptidase (beta-lactamase class C family)
MVRSGAQRHELPVEHRAQQPGRRIIVTSVKPAHLPPPAWRAGAGSRFTATDPSGRLPSGRDHGEWSGTLRLARNRNVLVERCQGLARTRPRVAVRPSTRFQASSISKQFVAVAVLQLVDQHVLALHDPIERWLPDLPSTWRAFTLHQLLSQTSGLGHWRDIPGLHMSSPPPRDELDALIVAAPLRHAPGTRWAYSGPGYLLAARVVEAVTHRPYGAVVQDTIFDEVGMPVTTSGRFPVGDSDVAEGHRHGDPVELHAVLTAMPGTGDVWTSATDLTAFAQALRTGELLSARALTAMRTPYAPIPENDSAPDDLVVPTAYGYGTFLGTVAGRPAYFHAGDNPGYKSLLAWLPDDDLDLAVLVNDDGLPLEPAIHAALPTTQYEQASGPAEAERTVGSTQDRAGAPRSHRSVHSAPYSRGWK